MKIDHTPEAIIVAVRLNNALETARLVDRPHRHNTHTHTDVGGWDHHDVEARNDEQQEKALSCGELSPGGDDGRACRYARNSRVRGRTASGVHSCNVRFPGTEVPCVRKY